MDGWAHARDAMHAVSFSTEGERGNSRARARTVRRLTQLEQLLQARCWDGHCVLRLWRTSDLTAKAKSKVGEVKAVSCARLSLVTTPNTGVEEGNTLQVHGWHSYASAQVNIQTCPLVHFTMHCERGLLLD